MKVTQFVILDDVNGLGQFMFDDGYCLDFERQPHRTATRSVTLKPQDERNKKRQTIYYACKSGVSKSTPLTPETLQLLKQHWLAALAHLELQAKNAENTSVIQFMWNIFKESKSLAENL